MELYYSPDLMNDSFSWQLLQTQTTDYLDFIWQKYFSTKPSEFQLQYLSRQQGKTWAILHMVILQVNAVMNGSKEYTLYAQSKDTIMHYIKNIKIIVNDMDDKRFIIDTSTSEIMRFKNGGVIHFKVLKTEKNAIFMDW